MKRCDGSRMTRAWILGGMVRGGGPSLDRLTWITSSPFPHGMPRANAWRWRYRFTCASAINVALAVEWDAGQGCYVGLNLLTMEMAYNNARLIARPEATLVEANQVRSKRPTEGHRPPARSDR